jgi:hypothetical protein
MSDEKLDDFEFDLNVDFGLEGLEDVLGQTGNFEDDVIRINPISSSFSFTEMKLPPAVNPQSQIQFVQYQSQPDPKRSLPLEEYLKLPEARDLFNGERSMPKLQSSSSL